MKVLIYSEYFLPIPGGVQTIVLELALGLVATNLRLDGADPIEVTVVTRTKERTTEDDAFPFRLVRTPTFRKLVQLIRDTEVVHLAGAAMLPLALSLSFQKAVIVEHHGYHSVCPKGNLLYGQDQSVCPGYFMEGQYSLCVRCDAGSIGWRKSFRDLILTFPRRWMCQRATRNVAVTNHVAMRVDLPRTTVIYHGIADNFVHSEDEKLEGRGDAVQIGYVGRLVSEKGLPLLLRAAKRLDDNGVKFQLTFVGGGPERGPLENLVRELGFKNRVDFLGELRGEALEKAVRPIQVVVMPSQCEETAGLAAIEQMMRGGVVIASDIGGLGEVVASAGLRFTAGDLNELYAQLRQVIESPSVRKSLGAAARTRAVQAFGRDSMIERHLSLYREALKQ